MTTAKNINQMNQNTIDAGQQMKTALDYLSIAYKELIEKNEKGDDEIENLEKALASEKKKNLHARVLSLSSTAFLQFKLHPFD